MRRAVFKDPSILTVEKVTVIDTVFIEVEKIDTVFKYKFDTVTFWKDKTSFILRLNVQIMKSSLKL
jgi:hypothetical protein